MFENELDVRVTGMKYDWDRQHIWEHLEGTVLFFCLYDWKGIWIFMIHWCPLNKGCPESSPCKTD